MRDLLLSSFTAEKKGGIDPSEVDHMTNPDQLHSLCDILNIDWTRMDEPTSSDDGNSSEVHDAAPLSPAWDRPAGVPVGTLVPGWGRDEGDNLRDEVCVTV